MGRLVNIELMPDLMDDMEATSVNGCFQGSDYWEPERLADKALKRDREYRQWICSQKKQLLYLKDELEKAEKRGYKRKYADLCRKIENIEEILKQHQQ